MHFILLAWLDDVQIPQKLVQGKYLPVLSARVVFVAQRLACALFKTELSACSVKPVFTEL